MALRPSNSKKEARLPGKGQPAATSPVPAAPPTPRLAASQPQQQHVSLHAAVQLGSKHACLAALHSRLAEGDDVNQPDEHGRQAIHLAAGFNPDPAAAAAAIRALVDAGADPAARSSSQQRQPLHYAARNASAAAAAAAITALLAFPGVDVEAGDSQGCTALHWAADNSTSAAAAAGAIRALLQAGADPVAVNSRGATPLHWAATNRCEAAAVAAIAELLPAPCVSVHARDRYHETPLHYIDTNKSGSAAAAVVQALAAAGANVNVRDSRGNTPLHAVATGRPEVSSKASLAAARALIAAGADPNAQNGEGAPPVLLALERRGGAALSQLLHVLSPPMAAEEEGEEQGWPSREEHDSPGAGGEGEGPSGDIFGDDVRDVLPQLAQAWRQSLRHTALLGAAAARTAAARAAAAAAALAGSGVHLPAAPLQAPLSDSQTPFGSPQSLPTLPDDI